MIHVGDFDSDERKDLVCRIDSGKKYGVALTDNSFMVIEC